MTAPATVDPAVLLAELAEPLCYARTAEGEPITSRGRVVVGSPGELHECLGDLLFGCTISTVTAGSWDMVYVTEWAAGR